MALSSARRHRNTIGVLYLDLDGFKDINNTFGHATGDALLKEVAKRLLASVREEDTVARAGGDEFIIALSQVTDAAHAASVASKAIEAVSRPYEIDGKTVRVTASAGIALYPLHGDDADALMKRADAALYAAKKAGKNVYRVSDEAKTPAARA